MLKRNQLLDEFAIFGWNFSIISDFSSRFSDFLNFRWNFSIPSIISRPGFFGLPEQASQIANSRIA